MYRGTAKKGGGGASQAMVRERCLRMQELCPVLGYMPFPGSLNLSLSSPFDFSADSITADITEKQPDGSWIPTPFRFWPILINGVEAHAVRVADKKFDRHFLEVYAPVRLRDFGDKFEITHR